MSLIGIVHAIYLFIYDLKADSSRQCPISSIGQFDWPTLPYGSRRLIENTIHNTMPPLPVDPLENDTLFATAFAYTDRPIDTRDDYDSVADDGIKSVESYHDCMDRYDTDVRDGVLFLESTDGWLEIGRLDDICELVGGETYTLEYDERQRQVDWLDTDDEGKLSFDVRETLAEMDFNDEFVGNIEPVDADETDEDGYPLRASVFADMMTNIWDSKGDL